MEVAVLISIGVLAAALGIGLGRHVWPAVRGSDPDALAKAQTEVARFEQDCIALRSRADQLDADYKAASGEARKAGEEVARLTERVANGRSGGRGPARHFRATSVQWTGHRPAAGPST